MLGERVHPKTGRLMSYVDCEVKSGTAHVADTEELSDFAWAAPDQFSNYVPYGFAPAVQEYLVATIR